MNKALKNTLNLFNLEKIDANLFVWDGTSTGYGRDLWWTSYGAMFDGCI